MSNMVWKSLYVAPMLLGVNVIMAQVVSASPVAGDVETQKDVGDNSSMSQMTEINGIQAPSF